MSEVHPAIARLRLLASQFPPQKSPEWIALRKKFVTGSEIATVIGQNCYERTTTKLLFQKCGVDPAPFTGNVHTRHGEQYEDTARKAYERARGPGLAVEEFNFITHAASDIVAFSPDGITIEAKPRLVEIKCPLTRQIIPGQVPDHYMGQVQLGLEVLRSHGLGDDIVCDFVQYKPATDNGAEEFLDITTVPRDPGWWDRHRPTVAAFVGEVMRWTDGGPDKIKMHPEYNFFMAKAKSAAENGATGGTGARGTTGSVNSNGWAASHLDFRVPRTRYVFSGGPGPAVPPVVPHKTYPGGQAEIIRVGGLASKPPPKSGFIFAGGPPAAAAVKVPSRPAKITFAGGQVPPPSSTQHQQQAAKRQTRSSRFVFRDND